VEPFGGAGWVMFARERHAEHEVFNDINGDLVNLFRCVKFHADAVSGEMEYLLNSREIFEDFKRGSDDGLTDIQRAARYMYVLRASYGAKMGQFGAKLHRINDTDALKDAAERLRMVVIENMSFDRLFPRYDGAGTLFYCDPPYYGTEFYYKTAGYRFDEGEHRRLREMLGGVEGRFMLTYNDCNFVRELYDGFTVEAVSRHNNLASRYGSARMYGELIIRNF
jgi:DNA adenine methylase